MKHTPCEYIVWNGLPVIRKGLTESMINVYGLSQNETAEKLGISPAAVSQYLSGKRGKMNITDREINKEFNRSAKKIIQLGYDTLVSETCRLCRLLISKKIISLNKNVTNFKNNEVRNIGENSYGVNKSRVN